MHGDAMAPLKDGTGPYLPHMATYYPVLYHVGYSLNSLKWDV